MSDAGWWGSPDLPQRIAPIGSEPAEAFMAAAIRALRCEHRRDVESFDEGDEDTAHVTEADLVSDVERVPGSVVMIYESVEDGSSWAVWQTTRATTDGDLAAEGLGDATGAADVLRRWAFQRSDVVLQRSDSSRDWVRIQP